MPKAAPRPCSKAGCGRIATKKGRCDRHPLVNWRQSKAGKGSGSSRGYGWEWSKTRQRILERDRYLCRECTRQGRLTKATEVDHIINKASGGTDHDDNLQSLCSEHHRAKSQQEALQGTLNNTST